MERIESEAPGDRCGQDRSAGDRDQPLALPDGRGWGGGQGQSLVAQARAEETASGGLGQEAGDDAEENQCEHGSLQEREILGLGGAQCGPADAWDGEDRLDRNRASGEPDRDQAELGYDGRRGTSYRGCRDASRRTPGGSPQTDPTLREHRGQRVVDQPPENPARRQRERQRREDQVLRTFPPVRRQPPEPDREPQHQQRCQQELWQSSESGRDNTVASSP
jgi:hypothetical protein